mmetsp:Transcript_69017/g.180894  ORF Transcript_69017/g.180894 Transcript_69017/m.180894 type:complete len:204 (+) Transcript_69017:932-1543(+)
MRRGVAMATSSLLMFFALSPDSLSSSRADHFRPSVSFTNSSSVCFASSREGSMTTARANSLPGLPSRTRMGPRKAIVLPLPVGAEARTWLPDMMTGKHCIWIAVGLANFMACMLATSQGGTPLPAMSSKEVIGSGAPAPAWMRFFRLKATTSSFRTCAGRASALALAATSSGEALGGLLGEARLPLAGSCVSSSGGACRSSAP